MLYLDFNFYDMIKSLVFTWNCKIIKIHRNSLEPDNVHMIKLIFTVAPDTPNNNYKRMIYGTPSYINEEHIEYLTPCTYWPTQIHYCSRLVWLVFGLTHDVPLQIWTWLSTCCMKSAVGPINHGKCRLMAMLVNRDSCKYLTGVLQAIQMLGLKILVKLHGSFYRILWVNWLQGSLSLTRVNLISSMDK